MSTPIDRMLQQALRLGMTDADLARACGISRQALHNFKVRQRIPRTKAPAIARALNVSVDWLMGQDQALAPDPLERECADLAAAYRQLSPTTRAVIWDIVEAELRRRRQPEDRQPRTLS